MYVLDTGVWETKKCNIITFFNVSRQILGQYLEITNSSYIYNQCTSFIWHYMRHAPRGWGASGLQYPSNWNLKKKYFCGHGNIKFFTWITPQLKSPTEIAWQLVLKFSKSKIKTLKAQDQLKKKTRRLDLVIQVRWVIMENVVIFMTWILQCSVWNEI